MILKKKQLAVRVGQACTALAIAATSQGAWAQETQRVEITGSSIKRVDAETALPVQVITRAEIDKTGYTNVTELLQSLPSMQGFQTASKSVNGGGGGATAASIHSIGTAYTLVLLNGRRIAPYTTGTSVNLDSIPLSMVERVEVLTDGASAIYGADAVAGVINFITKSGTTDGLATGQINQPQHKGASSYNASVSKGFGDMATDRYNVQLGLSVQHQEALWADERKFSKTGNIPFTDQGRSLITFNNSSNSIPGTVFTVSNGTTPGVGSSTFSPRLREKGSCGAKTLARNGVCRFDFASTVQDIPEFDRESFFGSGKFKINEMATVFAEAAYSKFKTTPAFAPPAQPGIFLTPALVTAHIANLVNGVPAVPNGTYFPSGDPNFNGPTMNLRLYDAGPRQDKYETKAQHYVIGLEGTVLTDVDYSVAYTHSFNKFSDTFLQGYTSLNAFNGLVNSGAFDPLAADIGTSVAILAPAVLHQVFDSSKSTIDVINAQVSKPLWKMAGGNALGGLGYTYQDQKFSDYPSALAMGANSLQPNFTDTTIGGSSGALPFNSSRKSYGVFGELVLPVMKELEISGALRYDDYDAVKNTENFDAAGNKIGAATQGSSASETTYKLTTRYQPMQELLLRGSFGTGFKAPTLASITQPVQAFGSTGFHGCPPGLPAATAAACEPVNSEYNKRSGGNNLTGAGGLKPEKSNQWTVGFRVEPTKEFSAGVDLWYVKLKDRIDVLPEDVAFSDGATYAAVFGVFPDPITGKPTLTETEQPSNLGKAKYKGLDFDVLGSFKTGLGKLTIHPTATYMLTSKYEVAGLPGYQTSKGAIGPDTEVTFKWLLNVIVSLETGALTNTFNVAYKPSYHDAPAAADQSEAQVVRLWNPVTQVFGAAVNVNRDVKDYMLIDWQAQYKYDKVTTVSFGIQNLFDKDPPFTIQNQDGTGNARGYDGRYADPIGRTYYLSAGYKF